MPTIKSLHKVQKHLSKKKGKSALHENSRDSKRLVRAGARDSRLQQQVAVREKMNMQYLNRVKFIQENLPEDLLPLPIETILSFVTEYVTRHGEELEELQKTRYKNKSPTARETNMQSHMDNEVKEFDSGYWIPDLTDGRNLKILQSWNGEWVGLNAVKFVRVKKDGEVRTSMFPPNGNS